jgi:hypothetical protein
MRQQIMNQISASFTALLLLFGAADAHADDPFFSSSAGCVACHNGLKGSDGSDQSIGTAWRPTMMANAARDPYWHAAVRRETLDHPKLKAAIEDKCATCHMPMTRYSAKVAGRQGKVFAHLSGASSTAATALAMDGASCATCHQIADAKLGSKQSFTGGFVVRKAGKAGAPAVFGPLKIDKGRARIMRSASGLTPVKSAHLQRSEVCATCHTVFTHARDPNGKEVGELAEQAPYLEWKHSDYADAQSCQDCHMPTAKGQVAFTSVLGQPREGFLGHAFKGANFLMPRLLNRYRDLLAVQALPQELAAASKRATEHLRSAAARVTLDKTAVREGKLEATVVLENRAGHKLPSAYPSRRVWLNVTVRDGGGAVFFESGGLATGGRIKGNANDDDRRRYEPHYTVIERPDQVQIYESIMGDHAGAVTTGLLRGARYLKDNRVLPAGFVKATAPKTVAVLGAAFKDADFTGGEDRTLYRVPLGPRKGPFTIEASLWYQPIAYRWAMNLGRYSSVETKRFVTLFSSLGDTTAVLIAKATTRIAPMAAPASAPAGDGQ